MKTKIKSILSSIFALSLLTSCEPKDAKSNHHEHNFKCVIDDAYFVSDATIDEPAKYYKTCECGEISTETFYVGSPISKEIVGEPIETNYSAFFYEYDDKEIIKTVEDIICPLVISTTIGNYKDVVFKRYTFNYETTYLDSSRIALSGAFTIPYYKGEPYINYIDVDSHATLNQAYQAPSLYFDIFTFLALEGALVIECDLLGFGRTNSSPVDYHCSHLAAKNTIDGIIAAMDLIQNELGISLEGKKMFNTGYSQGGYDAMALMRYLETEATDYEKSRVHFEHTYCGSGAYNLSIMFEDSLRNESFPQPEYILMGLLSAYDFHPEVFGNYVVEDFLTDYGKLLIQPVRDKDEGYVDYILRMTDEYGNPLYNGPKDIFNFDYDNPEPDKLEILNKFSELECLINGEWFPEGKLTLFYLPKDNLVSPRSSIEAAELFKNLKNVNVIKGFLDDHATGAVLFYFYCLLEILTEL